jgi:hypothetical protein
MNPCIFQATYKSPMEDPISLESPHHALLSLAWRGFPLEIFEWRVFSIQSFWVYG